MLRAWSRPSPVVQTTEEINQNSSPAKGNKHTARPLPCPPCPFLPRRDTQQVAGSCRVRTAVAVDFRVILRLRHVVTWVASAE